MRVKVGTVGWVSMQHVNQLKIPHELDQFYVDIVPI
jgi:hypothetical protein